MIEAAARAGCPSPTLELSAAQRAERTEVRGLDPSAPLEWGPGAGGNGGLWFERLVCPGGAMPEAHRIGSVGAAPAPSQSPHSGMPSLGTDILDSWEVSCPGEAQSHRWYTNIYRCGDPCPPDGFTALPAAAYAALREARAAMEEDRYAAAAAHARQAAALAPNAEATQLWLGMTLLSSDDPAGAAAALTTAATIDPTDLHVAYYRTLALRGSGRTEESNSAALDLLLRVPDGHDIRPAVQRLAAVAYRERGEPDLARVHQDAACAGGFEACCQ